MSVVSLQTGHMNKDIRKRYHNKTMNHQKLNGYSSHFAAQAISLCDKFKVKVKSSSKAARTNFPQHFGKIFRKNLKENRRGHFSTSISFFNPEIFFFFFF